MSRLPALAALLTACASGAARIEAPNTPDAPHAPDAGGAAAQPRSASPAEARAALRDTPSTNEGDDRMEAR